MAAPKYYKKTRWLNLRERVLRRDEYCCKECLRHGITRAAEMVHHCDMYDMARFYDASNLISLCNNCHNKMHDRTTDELTELGTRWLERSRRGEIKNDFSIATSDAATK